MNFKSAGILFFHNFFATAAFVALASSLVFTAVVYFYACRFYTSLLWHLRRQMRLDDFNVSSVEMPNRQLQ